jgi:hypothetical protein
VNIKNKKMTLHRVDVILTGRTLLPILVTPAQLRKLNRLPVGKEISLSKYYCYRGRESRVIRTRDGLQWIPSPYGRNPDDVRILEELAR